MLLLDRTRPGRSESDGAPDNVTGLIDDQQEPLGRAPDAVGAEVPLCGRLVVHPERCSVDTELADALLRAIRAVEAVGLVCAERSLGELDRLAPSADRQLHLDPRLVAGLGHVHSVPSRIPFRPCGRWQEERRLMPSLWRMGENRWSARSDLCNQLSELADQGVEEWHRLSAES